MILECLVRKCIVAIFIIPFLFGCATPYQQSGFSGGFTETRIDKNIFKVSFAGNGYTSGNRAYDFTLLRSAELTLEHGYKYFVIIQSSDDTTVSAYRTPTTANTYANAHHYGSISSGQATTTISGGDTYVFVKPGLTNVIVCYKVRPKEGFSYDAVFLFNSLTSKYKIYANDDRNDSKKIRQRL
jgi:hypothetical protein